MRGPIRDVAVQVALLGAAWGIALVVRGRTDGLEQEAAFLLLTVDVVAAVLLGLAGVVEGNHRARWIGAAVAVHAGGTLLLRALDAPTEGGLAGLARSVTILGVVGLLVLAVRRAGDPRAAVGVLLLVVLGAAAVSVSGLFAPGRVPSSGLVAGADLVAWSGAGATGVVLLLAGSAAGRPLLRRAGLAFVTLAAANAVRIVDGGVPRAYPLAGALELGGVLMLLVTAVLYTATAVRAGRRRARSQR